MSSFAGFPRPRPDIRYETVTLDPLTMTPAEYIKAARPAEWPNYGNIDLTGQEVCYLTYDYLNQPAGKTRFMSVTATCTGNYTVARGKVSAAGFIAEATWTAASGAATTKSGADTGTDDYVCYRITGTAITAVTLNGIYAANGDYYSAITNEICEIYARLPSLTNIFGLRSISVKYETVLDVTALTSLANAWLGCSSLEALDLTGWVVSSVTTMASAWYGCCALRMLDLSGWNVSNVTSLGSAWADCASLIRLVTTGWDVSKITSLSYAWLDCRSLKTLDLSDWNISSALTTLTYAFTNCGSLQELNLSGWNVSAVTTLAYAMYNCRNLQSLDLTGWDISSVTAMTAVWEALPTMWHFVLPANVSLSFTLSSSTNLSAATLVAVIANLKDLTGFTGKTLTLGSTLKAKLTAEQIAVATAKNWTVA